MARAPKPADPTAVDQSVSVQLPTELVARIDAAATERVVGRGFLLRYFIEQGMANLPALPTVASLSELGPLMPPYPVVSHQAPDTPPEAGKPTMDLLEA